MPKKMHKLPSSPWVNGGNIQIPLKDIPAGAKIKAFVFRFVAAITTGAAQAAIPSTQLHRLIQMIDIGPQVRGSGIYWKFLDFMMRGGESELPAGIPATNGSTFNRYIDWIVPFVDRRSAFPGDDLPHAAEFAQNVVSIDTSAYASLDGGTNTWNTLAANAISGTLRAWAILDDPNASPGSLVKYGFADLTGQAPSLDSGLYTDLFVYRENGNPIDSLQLATAAIQVDGSSYCDDLQHGEYLLSWDRDLAEGGAVETASATTPTVGEYLSDQPANVGAGAANTLSSPFFPLVWSPNGYKKSASLIATSNLRIDFTGTDTSFRVGYRKIQPRSGDQMVQSFAKVGISATLAQIAAKTGSKKNLSAGAAGLAPFLPLRKIG